MSDTPETDYEETRLDAWQGGERFVKSSTSRRFEKERNKARGLGEESLKILKEFYDAEWMMSHDWGGDRDSILSKVEKLLKENGKLD